MIPIPTHSICSHHQSRVPDNLTASSRLVSTAPPEPLLPPVWPVGGSHGPFSAGWVAAEVGPSSFLRRWNSRRGPEALGVPGGAGRAVSGGCRCLAGQDLRTPAVRDLECADRVADSDVIFSETAVQVLDQVRLQIEAEDAVTGKLDS